jgi:hypothetical protein
MQNLWFHVVREKSRYIQSVMMPGLLLMLEREMSGYLCVRVL